MLRRGWFAHIWSAVLVTAFTAYACSSSTGGASGAQGGALSSSGGADKGGASSGGINNAGSASGGRGDPGSASGGLNDAGSPSGGVSDAGSPSGGVSDAGSPSGGVSHGGRSGMGGAIDASSGAAGEDSRAGAPGSDSTAARTLYYLDVQGRVLTFDEDDPTPRALVSSAGQGPDGVAVDLAGGHIFWTDMGVPADDDGSILRADFDGSHVTTIVPEGGTYTPKQIKIDAQGQKLYWSDREGMRIQRAGLDGSELETIVTVATGATARKDGANWCVGMALDVAGGFFYWTQKGSDNGGVGSIRRAHLQMPSGETDRNRSDVEVLYEGLPEPIDLDIDVTNGYLYWTDRGDDTVNRAPVEIPAGRTAANRNDRQILVSGVREAIGVALDLERGHVYYTGGTGGRVGRANLDGTDALDFVTGNGAFTGIAVVPSTRP